MTTISLVADVGGTNTRVALANGTEILAETIRKQPNAIHAGLEPLIAAYLSGQGVSNCARAAVAVAGPVKDGIGHLTNRDWTLNRKNLSSVAGTSHITVLNDLQAQGHALGHIDASALTHIRKGRMHKAEAAMLVVGIGTGFNCAPVYQTAKGRLVPPSEAGHASLPIVNEDLRDLAQFVGASHGHAAVEDVLSGRGLENCYRWASMRAGRNDQANTSAIFDGAQSGDEVSLSAISVFVTTFGAVVGDLALTLLPFGGIYLVGGMARAIAPWMEHFRFEQAFLDKGRFSSFLSEFSIQIVDDDFAALSGCAHFLANADNQR